MTAEDPEPGTRGYCEVCTALDRLETRRIGRTRFSLCQACRDVVDGAGRRLETRRETRPHQTWFGLVKDDNLEETVEYTVEIDTETGEETIINRVRWIHPAGDPGR